MEGRKILSFWLHDDEHFLMKASPHISALHFSVIAVVVATF